MYDMFEKKRLEYVQRQVIGNMKRNSRYGFWTHLPIAEVRNTY